MVISAPCAVRSFVASAPSCWIVPSTSPMRAKSPTRIARENVTIRPLIRCCTTPLEPSEMITPTNTLMPLNPELSLPGT
jgi:hypothetical protein